MMRLTLRSGRDGRFLARIIDAGNGRPFVLDFGDRRIIDDVQQRLQHGFTMWRFGQLVSAQPQDADVLSHLAEFYVGERLLVALEEPTWSGRTSTLDERMPIPEADRALFGIGPASPERTEIAAAPAVRPAVIVEVAGVPDDIVADDATQESADATEIVEIDEFTDLGQYLQDVTDPAMAPPVPAGLRKKGGLRETFSPPVAPPDEIEDAATEQIEVAMTELDLTPRDDE